VNHNTNFNLKQDMFDNWTKRHQLGLQNCVVNEGKYGRAQHAAIEEKTCK